MEVDAVADAVCKIGILAAPGARPGASLHTLLLLLDSSVSVCRCPSQVQCTAVAPAWKHAAAGRRPGVMYIFGWEIRGSPLLPVELSTCGAKSTRIETIVNMHCGDGVHTYATYPCFGP